MENNKHHEAFKEMCKLRKNPPIDIEFMDLSYSTKGGVGKSILKSVSGKFYSGELTAILGASGSGKTTMLNVLAGYINHGVTGSIKINERPRQMKIFRKMIAYIMQEDLVQPHLSVQEVMMIAARLKLGDHISVEAKEATVTEVLKLLGLEDCRETRTHQISGGQRKRLSIALELVSNPPVIFIDEPTSGLDSVSVRHCIEILKILTRQGRTVICSVHQPSSYVFQSFNQVYFIQEGMCVYNGSASNLIPFMSSIGYECPNTHHPADYIIETVQTVQESVPHLVDSIQNGKLNKRNSKVLTSSYSLSRKFCAVYEETTQMHESKMDIDFPTSFWTQFSILLSRMMLQMRRNILAIWIQIFHHTFCAFLLGILFYGIGNNASYTVVNFKFCLCVMVFFVYTYIMTPVLLYPPEVNLLKREYFNRWYGLKPYFLAVSLRSLPVLFVLGMVFTTITYLLTDQPMELNRLIRFSLANILIGVASDGFGIIVGSIFSMTNGSMVAPAIAAPLVVFCIYGMGYGQYVGSVMKIVIYASYMRVGVIAMLSTIFDDRSPLECTDEIICIYQDPQRLLKDIGMANSSYTLHIIGLIAYIILFRLIAYLALRFRLSSEASQIIVNYISKIFRYRLHL